MCFMCLASTKSVEINSRDVDPEVTGVQNRQASLNLQPELSSDKNTPPLPVRAHQAAHLSSSHLHSCQNMKSLRLLIVSFSTPLNNSATLIKLAPTELSPTAINKKTPRLICIEILRGVELFV